MTNFIKFIPVNSYNNTVTAMTIQDKETIMNAKPGAEAIRTQIMASKPKREITKITNSHNTDRSKAVVLFWFSVACFWCQSFGGVSPYVCSYFMVWFGLFSGHLFGNSCSHG